MNAPLWPERLALREDTGQTELPLAAEGVLRYVWESRFGAMLIEVRDGQVFVNQEKVEPAERAEVAGAAESPPASPGSPTLRGSLEPDAPA